jgi:DNA polymerase III alpha subunit (gram-positive type)
MRTLFLVALLAIIAVAFAQTTAAPKKPATKSTIGKLLNKKVSEKTENGEKKKVKAIFERLIKKAQKEAKYTKLAIKDQVKIAKGKLTKRVQILKNILRKVTVSEKKDDAEKKTLKSILREFAAKDLLRASVQQKLLTKTTKGSKAPTKNGSKRPKPSKKGSKRPKPSKKASKKPKKTDDAVKKALADSEFLGKKIGGALKSVGKIALGAAKTAGMAALTGALA